MVSYSINGHANGTQGGEQMSSALYKEPESCKLMQMYEDKVIRQSSLSSSYCSSPSSVSSSPSADQLDHIRSTSTTIMGTIEPAQVSSMSCADTLVNPCSSLQVPTSVNSFYQLEMLNHYLGNDDIHGGSAIAAPDASYQLNNTGQPAASQYASHDHPHLSVFAPYISSTNHAEDSQHHQLHYESYNHNYFLQCDYNYSSYGQADAYSHSSQSSYAHDIAEVLGSSHEESIPVQLGSCSQLEVVGISMPLGTCTDSSQSASQSNDQKPQWGNIYSKFDGGERVVCTAHEISTVLSTSPAAGAKDKLDHSVAQIGETESRRLIGLTDPAGVGAYQKAISHNKIPSHDQGDKMAGLTTISPDSGTYIGDSVYGSADKAHHGMQQELGARSKEMIRRELSGLSRSMEAQNVINKTSSFQERQVAPQSDHNVSSSSPSQSRGAVEHMYAERKRRRKQGDCIDTLRSLMPFLPKKKDKLTVLKSTIEYITKLKGLVSKLEKEKSSLGNMNYADSTSEMDNCCCSQHVDIVTNSSQNMSSQTTATCKFIPSSISREIMPHFQLNLATSIKNSNPNVPITEIISALQNKCLHCIDFKSKFLESTSYLDATILAGYKDGKNYTPNLDDIEDIKQWWTHLIMDQLSAKWKL